MVRGCDSGFPVSLLERLSGLPAVTDLLHDLRARLLGELKSDLVGLYLYGSLAFGDFDSERSDLDLVTALARAIGGEDLRRLRRLHDGLAAAHPAWNNRIEVAYIPTSGLRTFKSQRTQAAIIGPDKPLQLEAIGQEGLIHYYLIREHGIALAGPPPCTLIDEVSVDEFLGGVRTYLALWREPPAPAATRGPQRYTVLTMCRGLYSLQHRRHTSKRQAALWAQQEFPEWAPVIERALLAENDAPAGGIEHQESAQFVEFALGVAGL